MGDVVAQRVNRASYSCNLMVPGSTPEWGLIAYRLRATSSHPCASVTEQYNLVSVKVKGRRCFAVAEVTADVWRKVMADQCFF